MRVAIFAPYAYKQRYFETELEIAQQHLDAGDEVTVQLSPYDLTRGRIVYRKK